MKVKPFLKWAGGKRWLVQKYSNIFPKNFRRYFEPFLGSGAVFFYLAPQLAVLSDINKELIETFRAIQKDWRRVYHFLQIHQKKHSKNYYYLMRSKKISDPFERAARFIYLNRTCWNGLYRVNKKGEFNVPIGTKDKVIREDDRFDLVAKALKNAELLTEDFEKVIDKAQKDDLVFVDPPYTVHHSNNSFRKYNEKLFSWSDQERLVKTLKRAIKRGVKIIGTNAYHESITELYSQNFEIVLINRASNISAKKESRGKFEEIIFFANI